MKYNVTLKNLPLPAVYDDVEPVFLTDETMAMRHEKVLEAMAKENFDSLIIYADKEHGSNFEYLTGFIPRFEEGLLVVKKDGSAYLILGNENLKMAKYCRVKAQLFHTPFFSLPNQPMDNEKNMIAVFDEIGFSQDKKIGVVGWKMFTASGCDNSRLFDLPYFIVDAMKNMDTEADMVNAAHLFIGGDRGVRAVNNANEIAHYEYGANLASTAMLKAIQAVNIGVKENCLGNLLNADGQTNSVVTVAATGERFEYANLYPTAKKVQLGDKMSLTTGYKGGLSSHSGYAVESTDQLPEHLQDYLEKSAVPYFSAIAFWLENIQIGMTGGQFYDMIDKFFPKEKYHWHLNPGHLVADEEWMSSPVYPQSQEVMKSGMMLQTDIIPSVSGYSGASAEECIALADEELRNDIQANYPQLWERIETRRKYIRESLGISLPDHVLPMSNLVGYVRPYLLNKSAALVIEK
ncbi:MAG: aminopeptidase P family N-terminal domain-containing protein [Oscillospiraceae bacterium]|nr:aminopeptidase P family N-terminal domain-containing protein [Oscillospiraceae bacterium]